MTRRFSFDELSTVDLVVDAVYESSSDKQLGFGAEPIGKLLPGTGNQGGFRVAGKKRIKKWVVLFSTGEDPDWPDFLETTTGRFDYFGDNKTPGHELHKTPRGGNKILCDVFSRLHASERPREGIPPFFLFKKYPSDSHPRSVQFKGLAVPGFPGIAATRDLVAIWKTKGGERFQNYFASFSVLDVPVIPRQWINDLQGDSLLTSNTPDPYKVWIDTGKYEILSAESTTNIRSPDEQTPDTPLQIQILSSVYKHFKDRPTDFEYFAASIFKLQDERVIIDQVTRASVDGGRDAVGRYLLGLASDPVYAEFSLEAKCYRPKIDGASPTAVGVKEVSRLISRIRHRQFGVLVTTSFVHRQAYQEVREDRHPIIFICGRDIAETLINSGINSEEQVREFLSSQFPIV
jgi:hypothetical protein